MKIGIIGTGHIGSTLARHFASAGHEVAVSNSRGPDSLRDLESELGGRGHATTAEEAERFGDVVVVSVPFKSYADIPAVDVAGKVVIDTTNYYPSRDGRFTELDTDAQSSSEVLAGQLDGARVVKAFNAIEWTHLRDKAGDLTNGQLVGIPISGDDPAAKQVVAGLIDQIGFEAVDAGSLAEGGRKHQPGSDVYIADLPANQLRSKVAA
ncbi:MAG TPA: NAD(P)-binding domain-containing protein [Trebonia sp.]|nr:NAD(P)-binding domain-containing protein [Trebonia sp.]